MAADVPVNPEAPLNPCCAAWKQKYAKLEKRRNALREAVQVLNQEVERALADNSKLKKAYEEERTRADSETEEKAKESAARVSLEDKISGLKSEIESLKQGGNAGSEDKNEVNLLQTKVSDFEKEISRLKELVEREKKRADSERKNAEVEKKKASEAQKAAKAEKSKADEERKRANIEKEKAKKFEHQLEVLKNEAHKVSSNSASETLKLEAEMAKADEQRKFVEDNRKKATEEKCRADRLSLELVESRKRIEELQKEINEIRSASELNSTPKLEEAKKKYESEKQKAIKEKKRADSVMVKAEKQKKLVEVNAKKAMEEKSRADHLSSQLDEAKKKIEELSSRKLIEPSAAELGKDVGVESANVKHLKKQLKFEKMQKKHAKEVVKLERSRNSILQQELGHLKLELDQFSLRLCMLNKAFSHSAEGIGDPKKMNFQSGIKLLKPTCLVSDASDPFREAMRLTAPCLPLSGGNCTDSISGIDSILDSPVRGSNRKVLQSSAINSSTMSFSDRELVGSQEKDGCSLTTSENLIDENVQPTISNFSAEVTNINCNENVALVAENSVRSPIRTDGVGRVNEHRRKRKRILHAVESIENLYLEDKKLHMRVQENLSVLRCLLNKKIEIPFEEGRYLLPSLQGSSYAKRRRLNDKVKEGIEEKLMMQNYADNNEQKNADKFENEVCECANVCRQVSENANELIGIAQASDSETISSFDEVTDGNYLKLLDLDNAADEECYRMAMQMPLSPTLPEIEVQGEPQGFEASEVEINSNNLNIEDSRICNDSVLDKNGGYVVFSNIQDSSHISRICYASRTCITQCSLATHSDWMVREILLALKTEEKLSPEDKVCVFFSVLLLNFSTAALSKFGALNWTSSPCLESFARHMCSVMSDGEGRSIFAEFGCLDESLSLIEDFLIKGRVAVCKDACSDSLVECHSRVNILLDGLCISSRPASADELVAGSIILASICAAFDHIGFICETSYNILQISRSNHSWVLTILHIFACLGGEKFFNFGNYTLVTVMKSIVTHLERGSLSDSTGSCIPSVSNSGTVFRPCVKCPFSEDALSVDTATTLLLERFHALLGAEYLDKNDNCGLGMHCDASCCLNKFVVPAIRSDSSTIFTLCDLSDLLSLVELVAINMSWEWTRAKVIPQLLKFFESCIAENVIAGIVVLLGQLGRIGVDALGYEDKGVEVVRSELSALLCRDSTIDVGLPTQIAIVAALLGLIPSDFETIISNVMTATIGNQSSPAQSIGKWFSLLPKKQQGLSISLLQTAVCGQ